MSKTKQEKWMTYAVLIQSQIGEMFQSDTNNYINPEDLQDEDNLKDFLHALANAMPTTVYSKLTGDDKNMLEFNHVANQLCFEYMSKEKS
jgi:hypothetical protein